jgi:adenosylhomocysteinase
MTLEEATPRADIVITVTGNLNVVNQHLGKLKDGCILANSGHYNAEINLSLLEELTTSRKLVREFVEEFKLLDGRKLYLLAEGRLLNLVAAEGHPAAVMDMSFSNQALSIEWIAKKHQELSLAVYLVPRDIDEEIARFKLKAMGVTIDMLGDEQRAYLKSW